MGRVRETAEQLAPRSRVAFDGMPPAGQLRFSVETELGTKLVESSGHIPIEEMEGWSDEELRRQLKARSGGKL